MAEGSKWVDRAVLLLARSRSGTTRRIERMALCSRGRASRDVLAEAVGQGHHNGFHEAEHEPDQAVEVDLDAMLALPLDADAMTYGGRQVDGETLGLVATARRRVLRLREMGFAVDGYVEVGR